MSNTAEIKTALRGEVDAAQIAKWKKEHPQGIYALVIQEKGAIIYFKKPTRKDLAYAYTKRNPDEHFDFYEALAAVTCISIDEEIAKEILEDDQSQITMYSYMETMNIGNTAILLNL